MSAHTNKPRVRKAVPGVVLYSKNGLKIGRPSTDRDMLSLVGPDWRRVCDIYRRLTEPKPMTYGSLQRQLHRLQERWPKIVEHDNRRGYRRRPKETP
jgi:hypothetical protein